MKKTLRAFIRYSERDTIIPGSLILRKSPPKGYGWLEIPSTYCCSEVSFPVIGTDKNLKAFVKYDNKGFIIPGTLLVLKQKPKSKGLWVEVPYTRCCGSN